MDGHTKKCVERYCELANRTTQQLYKVSTPCIDDHHFKEEMKICWRISQVCSQIVLKCVKHGTNWKTWYSMFSEQTCTNDRKMDQSLWQTPLNRLISYIQHTCEYKQYCYVGVILQNNCRLGLFQDSDFAGDLEDSKSTSCGALCVFGSHTFVPISRMFKKETSVSHSSTESEVISLDAGLRLGGIPALDLWDLIVAVLHGNTYLNDQERGDPCTNLVRKESQQSRNHDEFGLAMQRKDSWRACLYCIRKPGENQIWKSITFDLVDWAASKNRETC